MNIPEVFEVLRLGGSYQEQCYQYAVMLREIQRGGKSVPIADELVGIEVSGNGLCDWDKLKSFINTHFHKIEFETISHLFEVPPPSGYRLLYPDELDAKLNRSNEERSYVIGKIGKECYWVIKCHFEGFLIRLTSAMSVSKNKAFELLTNNFKFDSGVVRSQLLDWFDDSVGPVDKKPGRGVLRWAEIYVGFVDGKISKEDAFASLTIELGFSDDSAQTWIDCWQDEKMSNN